MTELSEEELATILCALRFLQQEAEKKSGCTAETGFADSDPDEFRRAIVEFDGGTDGVHFEKCLPLNTEEIDQLCAKLVWE